MLTGVSCWAAGACWAVGGAEGHGANGVLAERWNGADWSVASVPLPERAKSAVLNGVACIAGQCTAVGTYTSAAGRRRTLAERWRHGQWTLQSSPNPANASSQPDSGLLAVSCSSSTLCIALGYYAKPVPGGSIQTLAEHWNGKRWTIESPPVAPNGQLNAVSCTSSICVAVGTTAAADGATTPVAEIMRSGVWAGQSLPNTKPPKGGAFVSTLAGVSCSSANKCTAVGSSGDDTPAPFIERWDGASWSLQRSPANYQDIELSGVSCPGDRDCTAVGHSYNGSFTAPFAEQWHGGSWTAQATPAPALRSGTGGDVGSQLVAVSCTAVRVCVAVGHTLAAASGRVELRALAVTYGSR